jgi:hypothetical protein
VGFLSAFWRSALLSERGSDGERAGAIGQNGKSSEPVNVSPMSPSLDVNSDAGVSAGRVWTLETAVPGLLQM